tara:strand:+ start:240 stop:1118 length:879 start_codon:yes stop_codon:yes gene_type:complete
MITVKLQDKLAEHEPSFFNSNNQDNIIISRDNIEEGDVVIYTDRNMNSINPNSKYNIACLVESPLITKSSYDYIQNNYNKFHMILTFHKPFLDLNKDKFKLQLMGTTWMNEIYRKIYKKNKLCSIISSNKRMTSGHKLRHVIIDYLIKNNINNVDFYGGRFNNLPYMQTKSYTKEHSGQHVSNEKINGLQSYMFSIVIENCKSDYYFTEKLIDCFLTGTVPIFWGCPSIHKFFNVKGILIFNTLQECINIINTLTIEKYTEMLPYIKENFETAKKYTRYKFNEEAIMELINK